MASSAETLPNDLSVSLCLIDMSGAGGKLKLLTGILICESEASEDNKLWKFKVAKENN